MLIILITIILMPIYSTGSLIMNRIYMAVSKRTLLPVPELSTLHLQGEEHPLGTSSGSIIPGGFQTILDLPNIFVPGWVSIGTGFWRRHHGTCPKSTGSTTLPPKHFKNLMYSHTQNSRCAWKESSNINGCAFTSSNSEQVVADISNKNRGDEHGWTS